MPSPHAARQTTDIRYGDLRVFGATQFLYRKIFLAFGLFLLFAFTVARAQGPQPTPVPDVGPIPDWVKPIKAPVPSRQVAELAGHGGTEWLLWDSQSNTATHQGFVHSAYRVLTTEAIADDAQLNLSYNPTYQKLVWHYVRLIRNGVVSDLLTSAEKQLVPLQEDADEQTLDDRLQWQLHLHDIHVGDVVEYAYTITGGNPIFGDHWSSIFYFSWREGIDRFYQRVIHPADGPNVLHWKVIGGDQPPLVTTHDGLTELEWDIHNMAPVLSDDNLPARYTPYPVAFVTDWPSWAAVANWGQGMFQVPAITELPESLQARINEWRRLPTPEERAVAALEYVQDQIRYLALPFGPHTHQPYPVPLILERGFGDCKDKTLLLCTLLHALDIEAMPSFLSTDWESGVNDALPTPLVFDHVVVMLRTGSQWQWVDPTMTSQRGPLSQRYFPDYGFCLPLSTNTTALQAVTPSGIEQSQIKVHEEYICDNYQDPVHLAITTTFIGHNADSMRSVYLSKSHDELEKSWLNDTAKYYSGVKTAAPIRFEDDPGQNRFVVHESYLLQDFWRPAPAEGKPKMVTGEFYVEMVDESLDNPKTRLRTMPFALGMPTHIVYDRLVRLPRRLDLDSVSMDQSSPSVHYHSERSSKGNDVLFSCEYQILAREVSSKDFPDFLKLEDKVHEDIYRTITVDSAAVAPTLVSTTSSSASTANTSAPAASMPGYFLDVIIGITAVLFTLTSVLCVLMFLLRPFGDKLSPAQDTYVAELDGLRGWLILVGLGVCLNPVLLGSQVVNLLPAFKGASGWWLAEPALSNAWLYRIFFTSMACFQAIIIPALVLNFFQFFKRREDFPITFIACHLFSFLAGLTMFFMLYTLKGVDQFRIGSTMNRVIEEGVVSTIWIIYMLRSRRVKSTFTS